MGQTCGGTLNKDSPTRRFTSPNYPDAIQADITCEWIIEAPIGRVQLEFEVFNFFTVPHQCSSFEPTVSIYDGSSTSDPLLGQYCGDDDFLPPNVIMSSPRSLLVHYYSGRYGGTGQPGEGFVAKFSFPGEPHIDHCASSPCTNGGTCVDRRIDFYCLCPPGYVGTRCQDVDHCASSPCTHVGTCVSGPDSFLCLCPPEYVGTRCQVSKSSCLLPLGMENDYIEDNQISASSEKSGYEAYMGRLNGPRAWQPTVANTNQWLQVKFNNRTIITGIQTQGLWGGHVKSYRLLYGDTEDGLSVYTENNASNSSKVFDANSDGPSVVSHDLDVPISASIVRVNPQDFTNNLIRLRMEVLGCEDVDHCASSPCANGGTCVEIPDSFQCLCTSEYVGTRCQISKSSCLMPLGMENGYIEDNQISASSERPGYKAYMGRLNGPRAWEANVSDSNQWLQVKFNNRTIITGIQTQGLWGGHVKSYRLLYGDTEDGLSVYTETGANSSKVFDANSDGPTVVSHDLDRPFIASIVRVNPQDFTSAFIRLRMELLGCEDVDHCASSPCANGGTCENVHHGYQCLCPPEYVGTRCTVSKSSCLLPLGMENGDIEDNQISASSEKPGYEAYEGRLNGRRAWEANVSDSNQWLQVKFNNRIIITGIQTQGLWGGHVKSYRLLYGDTEDGLSVYTETGANSSKVSVTCNF
ncbi:lactadherin-like [Branchiostoma floridae x Branchiostoma belcheri]